MDALRICLLLFLQRVAFSFDSEVTLVKTIGKEPDFTPICTNETSNIIMLIVCKIRTERNRSECSLLYKDGGDFVHECDSRFTLKTRNHTVFLHLTSLTPADSGNYSCQCSNLNGTLIRHLSITVKENFFHVSNDKTADEVWSQLERLTLPSTLTAAVVLTIIVAVLIGCIRRRHPHCTGLRSETSGGTVCESDPIRGEDNSNELYTSLQQPTRDIYQTISSVHHQFETETNSASNDLTIYLENWERSGNYNIYENLSRNSL